MVKLAVAREWSSRTTCSVDHATVCGFARVPPRNEDLARRWLRRFISYEREQHAGDETVANGRDRDNHLVATGRYLVAKQVLIDQREGHHEHEANDQGHAGEVEREHYEAINCW